MEPYFLCEVRDSPSNGRSMNAAYVFAPLMFSDMSPEYENEARPVKVRPFAMLMVVFP